MNADSRFRFLTSHDCTSAPRVLEPFPHSSIPSDSSRFRKGASALLGMQEPGIASNGSPLDSRFATTSQGRGRYKRQTGLAERKRGTVHFPRIGDSPPPACLTGRVLGGSKPSSLLTGQRAQSAELNGPQAPGSKPDGFERRRHWHDSRHTPGHGARRAGYCATRRRETAVGRRPAAPISLKHTGWARCTMPSDPIPVRKDHKMSGADQTNA